MEDPDGMMWGLVWWRGEGSVFLAWSLGTWTEAPWHAVGNPDLGLGSTPCALPGSPSSSRASGPQPSHDLPYSTLAC